MKNHIWITIANDEGEVIDRFPVKAIIDHSQLDDEDTEYVGSSSSNNITGMRIKRCIPKSSS